MNPPTTIQFPKLKPEDTVIHECRIFDKDGFLKRIIPAVTYREFMEKPFEEEEKFEFHARCFFRPENEIQKKLKRNLEGDLFKK